ncbi:MAG: carbohydrate binding family 9 domain-containing protein, partial [Gemmatimonadota bacterium]
MRRAWCGLAGLVMAVPLYGQTLLRPADHDSIRLAVALGPRSIEARRITGAAPAIDGSLSDSAWSGAEVAGDFVEGGPHPGVLPKYPTSFQVLFDDQAIYFGIRALDPRPRTIVAPYPRRDDETRSDWFFVEIDSRHDRRTGFGFGINPRGVQVDAAFDAVINYDYAWDGVWQGASRIDSLGWTAEYRIPFSQL